MRTIDSPCPHCPACGTVAALQSEQPSPRAFALREVRLREIVAHYRAHNDRLEASLRHSLLARELGK